MCPSKKAHFWYVSDGQHAHFIILRTDINNSEFVIYPAVFHSNANSIQNPSSLTNPTMELYCILLPLTLLCRTTWQIANSLLSFWLIIFGEALYSLLKNKQINAAWLCFWSVHNILCLGPCIWYVALIRHFGRYQSETYVMSEDNTFQNFLISHVKL